jgi:ferredoxin
VRVIVTEYERRMNIDINVDHDLCIGSGTCLRLAPGGFALDEDGVATIQEPGAADIDKLRLAAEARPTGAITIAEAPHDAHV